jgi:alpha-1,6-mannosyltransferase
MTNSTKNRWLGYGFIAPAMITLTIGLGYFVEQSGFYRIIGFYGPLFLLYLLAYRLIDGDREGEISFFLILAVVLRGVLVFATPALSDDVYRFVWDGRLLLQGINPFDHLPAHYIENGIRVPGIDKALFRELNSPGYFTVYPPVAQGTFLVAAWLFPASVWNSAVVMKLFLFACEIGTLWLLVRLLAHFRLPRKNVLLYALNPLVIVEVMGNLHYEGAMVFFLLLAFWLLLKEQWAFSAVAMGLSIASKLLPLMFLPFLIRRLGWRRSASYFAVVGVVLLLLFFPLTSGVFFSNFGESLDLYFRKFEFNASVYYLVRWVDFQRLGYNNIARIGPWLATITATGILLFTIFERKLSYRTLPSRWLFAICLYLFLTTTVHPWYVSLPVVLCLFTRFRFPILWSGLIFFTYINYSYSPYWENLWVVALEYGLVFGFMIWELLNLQEERYLGNFRSQAV